jgi:RNA polymerase sigma factor (sigma-70 family)
MSSTAASRVAGELHDAGARAALEERFERLIGEHRSALARLAGSYTATASDREDLLQDIALNIWQALPGFRRECSDRTFVFRIAHNRAISYLARSRFRGSVTAYEEFDARDPGPNPEAALVRDEQGNRLTRAVRALPVLYRQVVMLALEEMDYSEIAEVLGLTESNVGVRLNRARQMLRDLMGGRT